MDEVLTFDSVLKNGRGYKGKTVREVFEKDKKSIFNLIKMYNCVFSDEVLDEANIKRTKHDRKVYQEEYFEVRDKGLLSRSRKLKKENKSIDEILDELDKQRDKYNGFVLEPHGKDEKTYNKTDDNIDNTLIIKTTDK